MKLFAIVIALVACRDPMIDIPETEPDEPAGPVKRVKPERKVILPAQGMVCEVGSESHAWWPDNHMTKLEPAARMAYLATSRDGTVYSRNLSTNGLAPVDEKGADDAREFAAGLKKVTGFAVESPTRIVAWVHGETESLHEYAGKEWKPVALPPRPENDTYSLQGAAYGPGGALWLLRQTGLFVRGANGFEPVDLGDKNPRYGAIATTADHVYVLGQGRFMRIDAERKVTTLAAWNDWSVGNDTAIAITKQGRVFAYVDGGTKFLLTVAAGEPKAKRHELGKAKRLLTVDGAGRAWVRRVADLVVIDGEGTQHVYAPGSVEGFPDGYSGRCTALGGGFAKLPAPGNHTGTLKLDFSGADNGTVELCASPEGGREPSPCAGASERIAAKLGATGNVELQVPTGTWEPAVEVGGKWYVRDYRVIQPGASSSCDIRANKTCSIQMRVER